MRMFAIALAGALLAGCAARQAEPPPVAEGGQCGAAALQAYVGKPRSELPATDPARTRIVCATCPVTSDYRFDRLNVVYDTATDRIVRITCG